MDIAGWLENVVCPEEKSPGRGLRRIEFQKDGFVCLVVEPHVKKEAGRRPPILFADFEDDRYQGWTARGMPSALVHSGRRSWLRSTNFKDLKAKGW